MLKKYLILAAVLFLSVYVFAAQQYSQSLIMSYNLFKKNCENIINDSNIVESQKQACRNFIKNIVPLYNSGTLTEEKFNTAMQSMSETYERNTVQIFKDYSNKPDIPDSVKDAILSSQKEYEQDMKEQQLIEQKKLAEKQKMVQERIKEEQKAKEEYDKKMTALKYYGLGGKYKGKEINGIQYFIVPSYTIPLVISKYEEVAGKKIPRGINGSGYRSMQNESLSALDTCSGLSLTGTIASPQEVENFFKNNGEDLSLMGLRETNYEFITYDGKNFYITLGNYKLKTAGSSPVIYNFIMAGNSTKVRFPVICTYSMK